MDLEVRWTEFSQDRLHDVFEYYKYKAGVKISQKLVNDLVDESLRLEKNPFIGQVEELLNDRIQTYRHLIFKNYKIIY